MATNTKLNEKDKLVDNEDKKTKTTTCVQCLAIVGILGIAVMYVASATAVQLLQRRIPDFELNVMRFGTALILMSAALTVKREWPKIPKAEMINVLLVGILNFFVAMALYVSITFVPLSTAQSIEVTSNITSGLILFAVFGVERITCKRVALAVVCGVGAIMVIQPEFIFPQNSTTRNPTYNETFINTTMTVNRSKELNELKNNNGINWKVLILGYILPFLEGIGLTLNVMIVKKKTFFVENVPQVLFWIFFISTGLSVVCMLMFERPLLPENWYQFFLICIHCLAYVLIWIFMMFALAFTSANAVNLTLSITVVLMLVSQYTVLSSILPGHRNWIEVVGVVLVLLGSAMVSALELWNSKQQDKTVP